jgi:hypothetical protein
MGRSWKDDDWHDADEQQEAEYRKEKRKKRVIEEPKIEPDSNGRMPMHQLDRNSLVRFGR